MKPPIFLDINLFEPAGFLNSYLNHYYPGESTFI